MPMGVNLRRTSHPKLRVSSPGHHRQRSEPDAVDGVISAPRISLEEVRARVITSQNPRVQRALLSAIDTAANDLDKARVNLGKPGSTARWIGVERRCKKRRSGDPARPWHRSRRHQRRMITLAQRLYQGPRPPGGSGRASGDGIRDSVHSAQDPRQQLGPGRPWPATRLDRHHFGIPGTERTVGRKERHRPESRRPLEIGGMTFSPHSSAGC